MNRWRVQWSIRQLCCSGVLVSTNRMFDLVTASQMASASAASFFGPQLPVRWIVEKRRHGLAEPTKGDRHRTEEDNCEEESPQPDFTLAHVPYLIRPRNALHWTRAAGTGPSRQSAQWSASG
jgi:hypothetical protein